MLKYLLEAILLHIMIKNKLLLMKNIFTKQFRHYFICSPANPTAAWQRNFYYYQNKAAVIHRIYYELPYINILLFQNLFLQLFISSAAAFITAIL